MSVASVNDLPAKGFSLCNDILDVTLVQPTNAKGLGGAARKGSLSHPRHSQLHVSKVQNTQRSGMVELARHTHPFGHLQGPGRQPTNAKGLGGPNPGLCTKQTRFEGGSVPAGGQRPPIGIRGRGPMGGSVADRGVRGVQPGGGSAGGRGPMEGSVADRGVQPGGWVTVCQHSSISSCMKRPIGIDVGLTVGQGI